MANHKIDMRVVNREILDLLKDGRKFYFVDRIALFTGYSKFRVRIALKGLVDRNRVERSRWSHKLCYGYNFDFKSRRKYD